MWFLGASWISASLSSSVSSKDDLLESELPVGVLPLYFLTELTISMYSTRYVQITHKEECNSQETLTQVQKET